MFQSPSISLGAARLRIQDLHGGDQPISTDDGDITIVFNGEIYNHGELRKELESAGHRFQTQCDSETVLHAFLEWDLGCFARLRGMFGVALWTESARRLVLARDRVGIKPLYFARRGADLYFGSELKAILVHPELERQLSLDGLDCYLSLNYVPCPWTLVEGVEKLPPGRWLEWQNGKLRSGSYWELPYPSYAPVSTEAACEQLDGLLQQAIREHFIADVPVGVWLSGGVDSSTILHYAAQMYGSRLKTFSISFRGRSFDETAYIREAVRHYGVEHEQLDLNPGEDLEQAVREFAYYSDEPSADAGALPIWFLSRLCKKRVTVALSGEGADELFGGYLTYRANVLARRLGQFPRGMIRLLLSGAQRWPVSDEKIGFEYKLKRLLEGVLLPAEQAHVYWNGTFSQEQKERLVGAGLPGALDRMTAELAGLPSAQDGISPYLWFDQKYYLADDILVKSDRMSMAHAVEVRPPFLDHRIVEFAASLPPELKIRGARQKVVLKELMKNKLPDSILRRKKVGLDIPAHEWLRGPLRPLLLESLQEASNHPDVFRNDEIQRILSRHLQRKDNFGYHLWGLMVLFLWMRKWRIQTTRLPVAMRETAAIGASI